ncbi:relaxase/mobilization nuclease domain-containing protein [uncultured Dokdonia sp.]|uniref:relaxase/mobilization nuclease domain-containing protein n=1 Tax=uncultured Dokdonia sp. TaxID=575653 RepID=UPI002612B3EB|nr:relaxase/mobilization nuclease domain-containing protein [uncultured Dokdonia sp.]
MIIKSKSYKHIGACKTLVSYLLRESERDEGFVLTRFIKGKNPSQEQIVHAFEENEKYRLTKRKNSVRVYMEILSFHKDNAKDLTNEKLQKIARKYISLRSNLSIAFATVHRNEKDHVHLHILLSGTEYKTGKSVRISRDDFKNKVKVPAEQYVRRYFPELEKSAIDHNKNLLSKKKS